jgi:hypothetical protein
MEFKRFPFGHGKTALVVGGLLLVFFLQCYTIAWKKSNTWDESAHILAGYAHLKEGMDFLAPRHHPVFGRLLTALPLTMLDLDFKPSVNLPEAPGSDFFPYSLEFLFENKVDGRKLLFLTRLPIILLGTVLGLYVFLFARTVWGENGAYLALFLYTFSPNILAHSSLATTDLTMTALFFIATYHLYRMAIKGVTFLRVLVCGVTMALAFATKHTAILLLPLFLVSFFLNLKKDNALKLLTGYLFMGVVAYITIWGVYGFRFHSESPYYTGLDWEWFQGSSTGRLFGILREWRALPESYLYSMAGSLAGASGGRTAFLVGQYSTEGWWHYFLVAFLIKTPVATIFFLIAAFLYISRDRDERLKGVLLLLPVFLIITTMSIQRVNIGLRHMLPAYPFIFTFIGYCPSIVTLSRRAAAGVFYLFCLWYFYAVAAIHPHQLAYFNEFIGGPKNGYKYLVDSNLDWGQDLVGLKEYMDKNNIDTVKLAYFGLSDPEYYGIRYEYLPSYVIFEPRNVKDVVPPEGYFAISATMLQGVYLGERDYYRIFKELRPVDMIGYSIFIYRFDRKGAEGSSSIAP